MQENLTTTDESLEGVTHTHTHTVILIEKELNGLI